MDAERIYDIFIIGGGINGCGVACDAAGRGMSVFLCEKSDLASGTSSASSKLIHGGLRYLEHYEFRLVKEALAEREILLSKAPHLVSPLKFTLPHRPHLRPAWMIRAGLFLYDHLSKRNSLPSAKFKKLGKSSGLKDEIKKGFEYYDCWVDDARLVVSNAIEAKRKGASIETHTRCDSAAYDPHRNVWTIECTNLLTKEQFQVKAKHMVNAAGPWMDKVLKSGVPQIKSSRGIRLIKGSHLIVPSVTNNNTAFILQNEDRRIVFVLPYQNKYSIIGTTDKEYNGPLDKIEIDEQEQNYLLDVYNQHFEKQLSAEDIVSSYSGVRPLCDDESNDPSAITRDYTIETQSVDGKSAFISIYGGKITTYRKLANAVMQALSKYEPALKEEWTKDSPLAGCQTFGETREHIKNCLAEKYPWLPNQSLERFSESYGYLCETFLSNSKSLDDLGRDFGHGLTEKEIDYLIKHEWALDAEDVLYRRTKLGYEFNGSEQEAVDAYMKAHSQEASQASEPELVAS